MERNSIFINQQWYWYNYNQVVEVTSKFDKGPQNIKVKGLNVPWKMLAHFDTSYRKIKINLALEKKKEKEKDKNKNKNK